MTDQELRILARYIAIETNQLPGAYYNTSTLFFSQPAKIDFDNRTNGFVVKNAGNQLVIFDDEVLQPGESKATGGLKGELFVGRKDLAFQVPAGFVGTPVNACYVTIKYYTPLDPTAPGHVDKI